MSILSSVPLTRAIIKEVYLSIIGLLSILIVGPLVILAFIPSFIWRPIAKKLQPYLRPDLGGIVSRSGSVFAQVDDCEGAKSILVFQISVKGHLNYENLLNVVQNNWISCKNDCLNSLRYPELQQYPINWAGYKFWKWDANFDLREHVIEKQCDYNISPEELANIGEILMCGSFPPNKSLWDVTLVSGCHGIDSKVSSHIYFRFHHALMDGYSLLYLVQRLSGELNPRPLITQRPIARDGLGDKMQYFAMLPYKTSRIFGQLFHSVATKALWKIPEHQKSPQWWIGLGNKIPNSTIKQIKNHFNVSFTAVVFAIAGGGLYRFVNNESKYLNVKRVPTVFSRPAVDTHPDRLCNKFSFATMSYRVYIKDSVERLIKMEKELDNLKDSPISIIGYYAFALLGSHFNWAGKLINSDRFASIVSSYFPIVLREDAEVSDCPVEQITFYSRFQQGQEGGVFNISAFRDGINLNPIFNASLLNKGEVQRLARYMEEEADALLFATTNKKSC